MRNQRNDNIVDIFSKIVIKLSCIPTVTKKIPRRRSLNGIRSASIWCLKCVSAIIIPARSAQSEYDNHKLWETYDADMTRKRTAPIKISFEFVWLTLSKNGRRKYFHAKNITRTSSTQPTIVFHKSIDICISTFEKIAIIKSTGITAKSWKRSIPSDFCPYSLLISPFSFSIFSTIAVDDILKAVAMIREVLFQNHPR